MHNFLLNNAVGLSKNATTLTTNQWNKINERFACQNISEKPTKPIPTTS